jgi:hypothetical protein
VVDEPYLDWKKEARLTVFGRTRDIMPRGGISFNSRLIPKPGFFVPKVIPGKLDKIILAWISNDRPKLS